jgi:hypothetical protein
MMVFLVPSVRPLVILELEYERLELEYGYLRIMMKMTRGLMLNVGFIVCTKKGGAFRHGPIMHPTNNKDIKKIIQKLVPRPFIIYYFLAFHRLLILFI